MAVSVTGPRAVNELGGPVIPGRKKHFEQVGFEPAISDFPSRQPQPLHLPPPPSSRLKAVLTLIEHKRVFQCRVDVRPASPTVDQH